jgi:MFS family permease
VRDARGAARINLFVVLYALAWAGGTIGYTPLLTILLPGKVAALAGADAGLTWLAGITLAGALAASLGGILFGYASDMTRNRRGWIAAGLALSCLMLGVIGAADTRAGITMSVVCWQLALNMMLGPLAALAGDRVPDDHKGVLGGLMAFAPGLGALSGALVTLPLLYAFEARLWLVAALVTACVLPVLLVPLPPLLSAIRPPQPDKSRHGHVIEANVLRMWIARLAVQIAEACLFSYLYFWLLSLDRSITDHQAAQLFGVVMIASAPFALVAGRWSDRTNRPLVPLQVCAGIAALGLVVMSLSQGITIAIGGYVLFGFASSVFLALHSAQTLRLLPRPDRRARDLGVFNLANTVPSLLMPWLALGLVPQLGYPALFLLLALLSGGAGLLLRSIVRRT